MKRGERGCQAVGMLQGRTPGRGQGHSRRNTQSPRPRVQRGKLSLKAEPRNLLLLLELDPWPKPVSRSWLSPARPEAGENAEQPLSSVALNKRLPFGSQLSLVQSGYTTVSKT